MGIKTHAPETAWRWAPQHDDALTHSPAPAKPQVTAPPHATVPPQELQGRTSRAAAESRQGMAPRQPVPMATAPNGAGAIAKLQAAHRLKQLHDLARAKQHDAAMRLQQRHLQSLHNEMAALEAEWAQAFTPLDAMDDSAPGGVEAQIWLGLRELGLALHPMEAGGAVPLAARPEARRGVNEQLLRLIGGTARQQRMTFEGVALQSLLDDVAVRDDADEPGPRGITRDMIGRARAVASARGLTPMAQRRLAALAPGAGAARRAMVEAAFEGLVQSAAEGGEISAEGVLSVVHDAMTNAGLRSAHAFSAEQTRSFINGLKARHPASAGVLGMGWMVEQALAQTDRRFGQGDVLSAISAALVARVPASARHAFSRPDPVAAGLRQVLGDIRLGVGEGQPLGPMLRLVLAQLEGKPDASDAELRDALPRLHATLDDIAQTAPSIEEAFVLRELLARIGVQSPELDGSLAVPELEMATYRGLARQQRQLDAGLARERAVANIWNAVENGNV